MLIGIVGKAGAGKDSIANHLIANYEFTRKAFADPLKEIVQRLFHMSDEQLWGDRKEDIDSRYGLTPRFLLQYLGTDVLRQLYPNVWCDLLVRDYNCSFDQAGNRLNVVVSDVRFLNEAEAIRTGGGHVWRVVCLNNPKDTKLGGSHDHPSEMEQDQIEVDHTFTAEYGDLPGLFAQVDEKMKELL
jgi:dephospho-CoA kinase